MSTTEDPLLKALMERYLLKEEVPTLELTNPKVLLSPPLWLLLIAKDKLTQEDLLTSRRLEGAYIQALRAAYIESFVKIFGDNKNKELLDQLLGYFKVLAQQYIAHAAIKYRDDSAKVQAASLLVEMCHFAEQHAEKLCLRVETDLVQLAKGPKAAASFRTTVLDLDPAKFSIRSEAAVIKVQKIASEKGGGRKHDEGADDDKDTKRKRRGKGKRKCIRCGEGPFTFDEFKVHNTTCK